MYLLIFRSFFFNDSATTEIYTYLHTLSLHAALPICADLSQCSDQDLAAFARAHREDAYRELLRRYKTGVYRLIVKQIGDADEAMDLTQETFVSGFSALDRYEDRQSTRLNSSH